MTWKEYTGYNLYFSLMSETTDDNVWSYLNSFFGGRNNVSNNLYIENFNNDIGTPSWDPPKP